MPPQVHPDTAARREVERRLGIEDLFYADSRIRLLGRKHGYPVIGLAEPLQRIAPEEGIYLHGFENSVLGEGHWNEAGHAPNERARKARETWFEIPTVSSALLRIQVRASGESRRKHAETQRATSAEERQNMTRYQTAILLLLATAQAAAPAVLEWLELEIGGSSGPRITPAGYAFVVWGVIVVLSLGYTLLQAFRADRSLSPLSRAIAWPLALVYTGFVLWLFAAVNNWLVATVAIFVAMFFLLRHVYLLIVPWRSSLTWPYRVLLEAQVGIYLGWTSIAIFANLAAALTFYGLDETGVVWQSAILIAAAANGLYGVRYTAASPTYTATVLWAFLGVLIGLMAYQDTRLLQGLAVAAILVVLGAWARLRWVAALTPGLPRSHS